MDIRILLAYSRQKARSNGNGLVRGWYVICSSLKTIVEKLGTEKLRGILSPRVTFVHEMMKQFITPDALAAFTLQWNRKRGTDFRVMAFAVYFCDKRLDNSSLQKAAKGTSSKVLDPWLSKADEVPDDLRSRVVQVLEIVGKLTRDGHERAFKYKKYKMVSPVELIGMLILIGSHLVWPAIPVTEAVLAETSDLIIEMRAHLHQAYTQGLYVKPEVFKGLLEFIAQKNMKSTKSEETVSQISTAGVKPAQKRAAADTKVDKPVTVRDRRPSKKARLSMTESLS